jgi:magnesium transporter
LLLSRPEKRLAEVMTRSVIKVNTGTDQEEVAQLAARYSLLAVPVTDDANHLVGIVTLDDIIDVVSEEATEDFLKMVGTSDGELVYEARSFRVAGIRLPWLLFNLVGLVLAGALIGFFEVTLREALFLFTFVPAIMGMGGSIGSQTSTIAVRGLATGRIALGEGSVRRFLWQQIKIGAILGVVCATVVGLGAMVWEASLAYGLVVGLSLFLAVMLASANGAMIPIVFERLGVDPAVAAGPLVTTSNDITGVLIYFGLATLFIELLVR